VKIVSCLRRSACAFFPLGFTSAAAELTAWSTLTIGSARVGALRVVASIATDSATEKTTEKTTEKATDSAPPQVAKLPPRNTQNRLHRFIWLFGLALFLSNVDTLRAQSVNSFEPVAAAVAKDVSPVKDGGKATTTVATTPPVSTSAASPNQTPTVNPAKTTHTLTETSVDTAIQASSVSLPTPSITPSPEMRQPSSSSVVTPASTTPQLRSSAALPPIHEVVIYLALVVFAIVLLASFAKKMQLRLPGGQHFKLIATLPLGPKERLLVIEIQGKQRVLGVTSQQINFLFDLETPLESDKVASNFHSQLQSWMNKSTSA